MRARIHEHAAPDRARHADQPLGSRVSQGGALPRQQGGRESRAGKGGTGGVK